MSRYLVLSVGCAECEGGARDYSLVDVLGVEADLDAARRLAARKRDGVWLPTVDGECAVFSDGELRIIELTALTAATAVSDPD